MFLGASRHHLIQLMETNFDMIFKGGCATATLSSPDRQQALAILFIDIRNFTGLMESQPAQTVIQVVRRLFTAFGQIVKSFKGKVVEIAGDSLYVVFGLQSDLRDAVNDAYQASRMFFQTVDLFNEAYAQPYYGYPLQIGVGLHAGDVFVGEFGLDGAAQLSVMGLPVNIASRLQAKTKDLDNDLIVSEEAYLLLDQSNTFEQRSVALQGISGLQQVRLAGKPYQSKNVLANAPEFDYLLAISG